MKSIITAVLALVLLAPPMPASAVSIPLTKLVLDPSFALNGTLQLNLGSQPFGFTLAEARVQSSGKVITFGRFTILPDVPSATGGGQSFLMRHLPDGRRDLGFGPNNQNGLVRITKPVNLVGMVIGADDSIYAIGNVLGYSGTWPNYNFVVTKFTPEGIADTTFGTNGYQTYTSIGAVQNAYVSHVAQQSDGKLLVTGINRTGQPPANPVTTVYLARLNLDGTPDSTFGGAGVVTMTALGDGNYGSAYETYEPEILVQPNGKILIVVTAPDNRPAIAAVMRFNGNGTRDIGFKDGGVWHVCQNGVTACATPQLSKLALRPDGRMIGVGVSPNPSGLMLVSFTADGAPDLSAGAFVVTPTLPWGTNGLAVNTIAVRPSGKIVVTGLLQPIAVLGGGSDATLQFSAVGQLDTSFGNGGGVTTTTSITVMPAVAAQLTLVSDGSVLEIAHSGVYQVTQLMRLTASGQRDDAFNTNYLTSTQFSRGTDDYLTSTPVFDALGRLYVSAFYYSFDGAQIEQRLSRFNANGTLDTTYPVSSTTNANSIGDSRIVLPSGKMLVISVGRYITRGQNLELHRFLDDGSLDTSFGANGASTILTNVVYVQMAIALPGDAVLLSVYSCDSMDHGQCVSSYLRLVRVQPSGSIDPTFGVVGVVTWATPAQVIGSASAGQITIGDNTTRGIMKYTRLKQNGTIDSTYGISGTVAITVSNPSVVLTSMQSDDALIVADQPVALGPVVARQAANASGTTLRRIDTTGNLDPTYGYAGSIRISNTGFRQFGSSSLSILADDSVMFSEFESPNVVHLSHVDRTGRTLQGYTTLLGLKTTPEVNTISRPEGLWVYGLAQGVDSVDIFVARLVTTTFTATQQINLPFVSQTN